MPVKTTPMITGENQEANSVKTFVSRAGRQKSEDDSGDSGSSEPLSVNDYLDPLYEPPPKKLPSKKAKAEKEAKKKAEADEGKESLGSGSDSSDSGSVKSVGAIEAANTMALEKKEAKESKDKEPKEKKEEKKDKPESEKPVVKAKVEPAKESKKNAEVSTAGSVDDGAGEGSDEGGEDTEGESQEASSSSKPKESKADIARAAYAIRQREKQLKARDAAVAAKEQEIAQLETQLSENRTQFQQLADLEPEALVEVLAKVKGTTMDNLVRKLIQRLAEAQDGDAPAPKAPELIEASNAAKRAEEARERLEAKERAQEEKLAQLAEEQRQAEMLQFQQDYVNRTISLVDEESYPVVSKFYTADQLEAEIIDVAERVYDKTGKLPTEAQVVDYLEERQAKLLQSRGLKFVLNDVDEKKEKASRSPSTLSNSVAAGSSEEDDVDLSSLDRHQRLEYAARFLEQRSR